MDKKTANLMYEKFIDCYKRLFKSDMLRIWPFNKDLKHDENAMVEIINDLDRNYYSDLYEIVRNTSLLSDARNAHFEAIDDNISSAIADLEGYFLKILQANNINKSPIILFKKDIKKIRDIEESKPLHAFNPLTGKKELVNVDMLFPIY